jgi:hypothetical protein
MVMVLGRPRCLNPSQGQDLDEFSNSYVTAGPTFPGASYILNSGSGSKVLGEEGARGALGNLTDFAPSLYIDR